MEAKKTRIDFKVHLHTEFGLGLDLRKAHLGDTPEETWKSILNNLPKNQQKRWFSITWEQDEKEFDMSREGWFDSDFNFDESVEVVEL